MTLPETHFHLDHLPPVDQYFIDDAENSVFQWPSVDYPSGQPLLYTDIKGNVNSRGIPIPTPDCTQRGTPVAGDRWSSQSRVIRQTSSFIKTKFVRDLEKNLGTIDCRYLYNPPWSLYDWHQDIAGHRSCINFLLTNTPGARTIHKFPMDVRLHYQVSTVEYKLFRPVLFNTKIDHCVINMTDKHRYMLSVMIMDSSYDDAKKFLAQYQLGTAGYL